MRTWWFKRSKGGIKDSACKIMRRWLTQVILGRGRHAFGFVQPGSGNLPPLCKPIMLPLITLHRGDSQSLKKHSPGKCSQLWGWSNILKLGIDGRILYPLPQLSIPTNQWLSFRAIVYSGLFNGFLWLPNSKTCSFICSSVTWSLQLEIPWVLISGMLS